MEGALMCKQNVFNTALLLPVNSECVNIFISLPCKTSLL